MAHDSILTQIQNQTLTVSINRPEKKNTLDIQSMYDLADAFKRANDDDEIKCIVLTGVGDYFCAGADISSGVGGFEHERFEQLRGNDYDRELINRLSPGSQIVLSIYDCYKPVISAINGAAAGVGATMILPTDFRLMADTAKIGYVFTRRGVVPEAGSTWLLPRVVGLTKASDWLISGRLVEAPEAKEAGLVTEVYSRDDLLPAAYKLANELITTTSAVSVACTRQLLLKMAGNADLADAAAMETSCFVDMLQTSDAQEGMMSFMEKRPPKFQAKVSKDLPRVMKRKML